MSSFVVKIIRHIFTGDVNSETSGTSAIILASGVGSVGWFPGASLSFGVRRMQSDDEPGGAGGYRGGIPQGWKDPGTICEGGGAGLGGFDPGRRVVHNPQRVGLGRDGFRDRSWE